MHVQVCLSRVDLDLESCQLKRNLTMNALASVCVTCGFGFQHFPIERVFFNFLVRRSVATVLLRSGYYISLLASSHAKETGKGYEEYWQW